MVTIAYFASRKQFKNNKEHQKHLDANDGWIMLAVYSAFLTHAIIKARKKGESGEWDKKKVWLLVARSILF